MDEADEPTFVLDFRPAKPSPPPTLIIKRKKHQMPIVLEEDEGFELYLLLKAHYEGENL